MDIYTQPLLPSLSPTTHLKSASFPPNCCSHLLCSVDLPALALTLYSLFLRCDQQEPLKISQGLHDRLCFPWKKSQSPRSPPSLAHLFQVLQGSFPFTWEASQLGENLCAPQPRVHLCTLNLAVLPVHRLSAPEPQMHSCTSPKPVPQRPPQRDWISPTSFFQATAPLTQRTTPIPCIPRHLLPIACNLYQDTTELSNFLCLFSNSSS